MIIKNIPEEVYIKALEKLGVSYTRQDHEDWTAKNEYELNFESTANGELNEALAEYIISTGEWGEE
jgi:hypothetical protein